jgi:hypothetical protein
MYELHGWFGLAESTDEDDDLGQLADTVRHIEELIASSTLSNVVAQVQMLNGQYFLLITGFPNRRRGDAVLIDDIIELVRQRLPGSWGLLYERDDEMEGPPGPNAFRVTVLARGTLSRRLDPFLSPCAPTIED